MFKLKLVLKRGGILIFSKLLIFIIFCILIVYFFGLNGFFGFLIFVLVICIFSCNLSIYIVLMNDYGDDLDFVIFGMLNFIVVFIFFVCILNIVNGGGMDINIIFVIGIFFVLGIILGNFDCNVYEMLKFGNSIIIFFLGFLFGFNINIFDVFYVGICGFLLLIIFYIVNIILMIIVDKVFLN